MSPENEKIFIGSATLKIDLTVRDSNLVEIPQAPDTK